MPGSTGTTGTIVNFGKEIIARTIISGSLLVAEVSDSSKEHRQPQPVGGGDYFEIAL